MLLIICNPLGDEGPSRDGNPLAKLDEAGTQERLQEEQARRQEALQRASARMVEEGSPPRDDD